MKRLLVLTVACLAWAPLSRADEPRNIQETITYLQKLQTKPGGFLLMQPKENEKVAPNLRATSAAVRALKYFNGQVPDAKAAAQFVASCHDKESGGFANFPGGKPDVFVTAVGIMAVPALNMPTKDYADGVVKYLNNNAKTFEDIRIAVAGLESINAKAPKSKVWLDQVYKMQNADGTFGKGDGQARDTGSAVVALLRLGGEIKNKDSVLKVLQDGQRLNGAYGKSEDAPGSDLETSYRVMRAFFMLKALPKDVEALRSFVEKCRNNDGGYSVTPGERSNVAGTYYASIIHHWLKDKK
jgi:prenyltransferase beta subunit